MTGGHAPAADLVLKSGTYTLPATRRGPSRSILAGADLHVGAGERVGIVGPNGAGKTTVLRVLAGMLTLQGGALSNGPHRSDARSQAYQRSVHLVLGGPLGFYPRLTGVENLQFVSGVFGHFLTRHAAQDVLASVGLAEEAGRRLFATFSLGMRQRLHLAAAVVDRGASVWLLDEPTTGLDTDGVDGLTAAILGQGPGTAIAKVIVSHDLAFLERVCHRTVELKHGALVA